LFDVSGHHFYRRLFLVWQKKNYSEIWPNSALILLDVKKSEIWRRFSTRVAYGVKLAQLEDSNVSQI